MTRTAHGQAGFTLPEMLVSLALVGLAAVMLSAGIAAIARDSHRQQGGDAALTDVSAAQIMLRARIEMMQPVTSARSSLPDVDAHGTPASFDFIGEPVGGRAPDALQRYRLARTAAGDLILYAANTLDDRVDAGDEQTVGWTPMPLLSGTSALSIGFFGTAPTGGGRAWQGYWFDRQQPPELVRIAVTFPRGDHRVWPELVIRPRATMNTVCQIDAASGRCAVRG